MKFPWEDIDSCSWFTGRTDTSICGQPSCYWYDATALAAYGAIIGRCKSHPPLNRFMLLGQELSRDEAVAMSVMTR